MKIFKKKITREKLLKGAALMAFLGAAGGLGSGCKKNENAVRDPLPEKFKYNIDEFKKLIKHWSSISRSGNRNLTVLLLFVLRSRPTRN